MTQPDLEYVAITNDYATVDGVLRRGANRSRTVVVQTHPRRDSHANLNAWPLHDLATRGFDTFGFNNRSTNGVAGTDVITLWEPLALDVAAAVLDMRRRGYDHVILYGWSAGGSLATYYQWVAESGNQAFGAGKTLSGFDGFLDSRREELRLPPADGIVLQNSSSGPAHSFLIRLDGSVVEEHDVVRAPDLDLFNPDNGYDPDSGKGNYSVEFLRSYSSAQAVRMNRLVLTAQERLQRLLSTGQPFVDDAFLVIPGVRAAPAHVDLAVASSTVAPWPRGLGDRAETVSSTRRLVDNAAVSNRQRAHGTAVHTLRSFLSYRALVTDPATFQPYAQSPQGLDVPWTNTSTDRHVRGTAVPLLVTAGTSDIEVHLPIAELIYNAAVARDKSLVFIDGANHEMQGAGDEWQAVRTAHLDVVASWLEGRFQP